MYALHSGSLVGKVVLGAGIVALALAGWWFFLRPEPPAPPPAENGPPSDPRLTFETPFRNVRPEVRYVGDRACADCHADLVESFHHHPMGRSAALILKATPVERYDAAAHNPFTALGRFELRVEKQPDRVLHHIAGLGRDGKKVVESAVEPTVAIGSATKGRSYLYARDGRLRESPITWYPAKQIWDLSPGYTNDLAFQRPITTECLFCHTERVEAVPGTENRYREPFFPTQMSIGCERCHGPGELHVAERTKDLDFHGLDTSIVNPKHLPDDLRASICQQCHLHGEVRALRRGRDDFDFRPGLPLEAFLSVYTRQPGSIEYAKSVSHFEQMGASKCFTGSGGKLSCTSCHDPHAEPAPAAKAAFYRGKCMTCHQDQGCSLPLPQRQAKQNDCAACHMPGTPNKEVSHVAVTDHRIPRDPAKAPAPRQELPAPDEPPLVPYFSGRHVPDAAERDRDFGVALAKLAAQLPPSNQEERLRAADFGEGRLRDSLKRWPNDVPALEGLASVCYVKGWRGEELELLKKVLALEPGREKTLRHAGEAALALRELDFAAACATKLVDANPCFESFFLRAQVRMFAGQWEGAEADATAALRELPTHLRARVLLAKCLQNRGDVAGARKELELALSMVRDPNQERSLRNLFHVPLR